MGILLVAIGAVAVCGSFGYALARMLRRPWRWAAVLAAVVALAWLGVARIGFLLAAIGDGGSALGSADVADVVQLAGALGWCVGLALTPPRPRRRPGLTRYLFSIE